MKIVLDDIARTSVRVRPKFTPRIDRGVNAGVNLITDDGTELPAAGIDENPVNHRSVIFPIMAEIRGGGASAEVDLLAKHGIADVGKMTDVRLREYQAILDFHGLADVTLIADASVPADITIRADFTVGSDDDVALDEDTGKDPGTRADVDDAFDDG